MRSHGIVEAEISTDTAASFGHRRVGVEIYLLVFHRAPKALYEDVVAPAAPFDKLRTGLPSMLIAIFSRWRTPANSVLVNWADSTGRRNTSKMEA